MDTAVLERPQQITPDKPHPAEHETRETAVESFKKGLGVLQQVSGKIWDRLQVADANPSQEEERILNGKLTTDTSLESILKANGKQEQNGISPEMSFIHTHSMGERKIPYGVPVGPLIDAIAFQVAAMDTAKEFVTEEVTAKIDEEVASLNLLGKSLLHNSIQLQDLVRGRTEKRGEGNNEGVRIFFPPEGQNQLDPPDKSETVTGDDNSNTEHIESSTSTPALNESKSPLPDSHTAVKQVTFPAVTGSFKPQEVRFPVALEHEHVDSVSTSVSSGSDIRLDAVRSDLRTESTTYQGSSVHVENPATGRVNDPDNGASTPTRVTPVENPGNSVPEHPEITDEDERKKRNLKPLVGLGVSAGLIAASLLTGDGNHPDRAGSNQLHEPTPKSPGVVQYEPSGMPSQNTALSGLHETAIHDNPPIFDKPLTDLTQGPDQGLPQAHDRVSTTSLGNAASLDASHPSTNETASSEVNAPSDGTNGSENGHDSVKSSGTSTTPNQP